MNKLGAELGTVAALVAMPVAVGTPTATAQEPPAARNHCVVETAPMQELADGARTEARCYSTVTEMLRSAGLASSGETSIGPGEASRRLLGAGYLAYHHVDGDGGGGSLAVTGSCDGGGLNLGSGWNDVISSTRHQACGRIKHFSDANGGGDHQITQGAPGALVNMNVSLNDRVTSIYYYGA